MLRTEGDALLTKDLGRFEGAVNGLGANLSQQQFDGLVDFAFNVRHFGDSPLFSNVASGSAVTEGNFTAYGHALVNRKWFRCPPAPGILKTGASFEGKFYLSQQSGLYEYRSDGSLQRI